MVFKTDQLIFIYWGYYVIILMRRIISFWLFVIFDWMTRIEHLMECHDSSYWWNDKTRALVFFKKKYSFWWNEMTRAFVLFDEIGAVKGSVQLEMLYFLTKFQHLVEKTKPELLYVLTKYVHDNDITWAFDGMTRLELLME